MSLPKRKPKICLQVRIVQGLLKGRAGDIHYIVIEPFLEPQSLSLYLFKLHFVVVFNYLILVYSHRQECSGVTSTQMFGGHSQWYTGDHMQCQESIIGVFNEIHMLQSIELFSSLCEISFITSHLQNFLNGLGLA